MGTRRTIGSHSLAIAAWGMIFALATSAPANAQYEAKSIAETVVVGPGGTCEFQRNGTSVLALITIPDPYPAEGTGTYCQVPEGFRPLTRVDREVAAYVGHPQDEEAERANVIEYVSVHPNGSITSFGGKLETLAKVVTAGVSFELDWFTATNTVSGTFANLAEHHDGRFNLARGGIFVGTHLATTRSPVQYWARQAPENLFLVPEGFRPHILVVRTVKGVVVDSNGVPVHPPRVVDFEITVAQDGAVRYRDGPLLDGVGYLAYELNMVWETAPSPDRAVLEEIHAAFPPPSSLYGANWLYNWGLDDVPLAQWRGVSTDAYGKVTHLNISAGGGTGTLPQSIGRLNALRMLQLRGIEVPDYLYNSFQVPDSLANLALLETLILDGQFLTTSLVAALSRLVNLRTLSLNDAGLGQVPGPLPLEWSELRHLEALDLCSTRAIGHLPPSWHGMHNLERLNICGSNLEGPLPVEWAQMANLRILSLNGTGITGPLPPDWSELRRLQVLDLHRTRVDGHLPPSWSGMKNLESLTIYGSNLEGPLPPEWSLMPRLTRVHLSETGLASKVPPVWGMNRTLQAVYLDRKINLTALRQEHLRGLLRTHALEPSTRTNPCRDGYVTNVYYCSLNSLE